MTVSLNSHLIRLSLPLAMASFILLPGDGLAEDQFTITIGDQVVLDETMDKASVRWATEDNWHFAARRTAVRIAPFRIGDTPEASTDEFVANNTGFSFETLVDGKKRRVGCDPQENDGVSINRSELSDDRVSGNFTMTIVKCDDFYTSETVAVDGLPFTVKGTFSVAIKR